MEEKINRVLFDNGADLNDIDPVYLIKFYEEKLESISFEIDEYYNIYKEVDRICRFTKVLKLKGIDYDPKMADVAESFSVATGRSLDYSINLLSAAMTTAIEPTQRLGRALRDLGSKL